MSRVNNNRRSVYIGEPIESLLSGTPEGGNFSGIVNSAVGRYLAIIEKSMPAFSLRQWMVLFDSLNGFSAPSSLELKAFDETVHHGIFVDCHDKKWNVAGKRLHTLIEQLSAAEKFAIIYAAERFWVRFSGQPVDADGIRSIVGRSNVLDTRLVTPVV